MYSRPRLFGPSRRVAAPVGRACLFSLVVLAQSACEPGSAARPEGKEAISSTPARLRRLSAREIRSGIEELTAVPVDEGALPERVDATGYDNGPGLLDFAFDETQKLTLAAERAVAEASRRNTSWVSPACARGAHPECKAATLARVARVFRRPLATDDEATFGSVYDARIAAKDGGPRPFETTLVAALVSPSFLYREELGTTEGGTRTLLAREVAVGLSFMTTGVAPDDELAAAASDGSILDAGTRRAHAERLLATDRGRATLRAFVEQWLHVRSVTRLAKDAKIYPEVGPELAAEMRRDLAATIDDTLAGEGSLAALLTTRAAFPGKRLSALYGVAPGGAFGKIELDESRAGIFTRAGLLAVHSASDGSGPIARGLAVRASLLCATLPSPPPGIPRAVASQKARTTRERFAEHTRDARCQGCHARIDGVGFGFEGFDGIGRARSHENGVPIDDSGTLFDADVADGPFRGVAELERRVLASEALGTCFVGHALRFAFGDGGTDVDTVLVRELAARFRVDAPIAALFVDIAAHDAFVKRISP